MNPATRKERILDALKITKHTRDMRHFLLFVQQFQVEANQNLPISS